tara:strand:- start:2278 stop:3183 length:906 start_codon:yes stop_codon:yes gene_type:complete
VSLTDKSPSIGIIIPTLNAENDLKEIFKYLNFDKFKVLIIDSNSTDNTKKISKNYNCEFVIENNFNHGSTRERARKILSTDIVVYLTQDAHLFSHDSIDELIKPLLNGEASMAYGRQLPRKNSSIFESTPVEFNYPNQSHFRSINDIKNYGVFTYFFSNNFSAYINSELDEIGGFKKVLTGEDYFACRKILKNGKIVAYVSSAKVYHSHNFSLLENFRRYFDTGYVRGKRKFIQSEVGHADYRGFELSKLLIKKVTSKNILLLPYALVEILFKYLGYKIGFFGINLPILVKKKLSNQKYYW